MIVIITTSGRLVCQSCSSCTMFSILRGRTVDWEERHQCACGGEFVWEPCTITGFDRHDPKEFAYGSDPLACP